MAYESRDTSDELIKNFFYTKLDLYKMCIEEKLGIVLNDKTENEIFYENYFVNCELKLKKPTPDIIDIGTLFDENKDTPADDNKVLTKDDVNGIINGGKSAGEVIAEVGKKILQNKYLNYDHNVVYMEYKNGILCGDCSAFTSTVYHICADMNIGRHTGLQILDNNGGKWADFSNNVTQNVNKSNSDGFFLTGNKNCPNIEKLAPGDLLFYGGLHDSIHISREYGVSHVELYVGNGKILGAGNTGVRVLRNAYNNKIGGWYIGAKRFVNANSKIKDVNDFKLKSVTDVSVNSGINMSGKELPPQNVTIFESIKILGNKSFAGDITNNTAFEVDSEAPKGIDINGNEIKNDDKLSPHFTVKDLAKPKAGFDNRPTDKAYENLKLLANTILEPIMEETGIELKITSGYRCPEYNKSIGGVSNSQHVDGAAADINNGAKVNLELYKTMVKMVKSGKINVGQLIFENHSANNSKYPEWIHISLPRNESSGNRALSGEIIRVPKGQAFPKEVQELI